MHQCLGFLCLVSQGASLDSSARFPRHIHDKGHSDPACGAQMSRKNCDMSGTCQPPSSCSRAYVTRLGAQKSRSHVTRLLIGTLTIALWSSSTQSTLVADTPFFYLLYWWYIRPKAVFQWQPVIHQDIIKLLSLHGKRLNNNIFTGKNNGL